MTPQMPSSLSETEARSVLGRDVLGAAEVQSVFGAPPAVPALPFVRTDLEAAAQRGEMLVLRVGAAAADPPLTILEMLRRFPDAFDARYLRKVGYQLKDEWGIELEPRAGTDTCTTGWALVRKEVLAEACNLIYDDQACALQGYAAQVGAAVRRRSAVEIVYDTLLYFRARDARLLQRTWDWSDSLTLDGGLLNVGGFGPAGLQILSYSKAVRHGGLSLCPTRQPGA
jgi:hypothetical protein